MSEFMWADRPSSADCLPAEGYVLEIAKWARGWGWHIDTVPSAVLRMDSAGRITDLPGGALLASGNAKDIKAAKLAAEGAWRLLKKD